MSASDSLESGKHSKWLPVVLGIVQVFIGISAIPFGLMMILDPSGVESGFPPGMLEGSPFPNYLIPGLYLFLVNGVGSLIGAVATFFRFRYAGEIAAGLGLLMMSWILVQLLALDSKMWLQPLYFGLGAVELVLGLLLRRRLVK